LPVSKGAKAKNENWNREKPVCSVAHGQRWKADIDDAHYSLRQVRVEDELF
jgi:hypothetical protein